ncbi:short transient receptor potential channel 7-like [Babylonia areolata]|uniref:short transient receptor potential channel 7-like n=1 Tax=Babylonia areolata TaxID=304850 RepID=UPI003FD07A01
MIFDRHNWHESDPHNLAEGLIATANIVVFFRILYLLPANETLGPMQIILSRTINDIIKILVFIALAMAGFIFSLRNLFWWYGGQLKNSSDPITRAQTNAATSFIDARTQLITVFWWIYGRGPMGEALSLPKKYQNDITETVGNILSALYHITVIIVFVNLFIAMMARSFEKIVDDVDSEWKYARSSLYMQYIDENCTPPVPYNLLLPILDVIKAAVNYIRHCRRWKTDPPPTFLQRRRACYNDDCTSPTRRLRLTGSNSDDTLSYKDIIHMIVHRYIFDVQREEEQSKGKLEETQQSICQFKWELLDLIDESGEKTVYLNSCMQAVSSEMSTHLPPTWVRKTLGPGTSSRDVRKDEGGGGDGGGGDGGMAKEKDLQFIDV